MSIRESWVERLAAYLYSSINDFHRACACLHPFRPLIFCLPPYDPGIPRLRLNSPGTDYALRTEKRLAADRDSNLARATPVTTEHTFLMGSITKSIAAVAVLTNQGYSGREPQRISRKVAQLFRPGLPYCCDPK